MKAILMTSANNLDKYFIVAGDAERLTELNLDFNHQRQTTITEELLDIISGFEAIAATDWLKSRK